MSESMETLIDVSVEEATELSKRLSEISEKHNAVLLACIAPYVGRKVSPSRTISAYMGLSEEFAVETVINEISKKTDVKKLMLLINSPGGLVQSSYKVARALRQSFEEIIVFIPHIAASGGALIALTGNEIVGGMMSQLTPLDPHSDDESGREVSSLSVVEAHAFVTTFFKDKVVEDAPYTYKALADGFDAIDIYDALSSLKLMEGYVYEILKGSGYSEPECKKISTKMVRGFRSHSEVINMDKAKEIGLKVVDDTKYSDEWTTLREWLGKYMLQSADKHIIRYNISQNLLKTDEKPKEPPM